jgi:hypothetical protein
VVTDNKMRKRQLIISNSRCRCIYSPDNETRAPRKIIKLAEHSNNIIVLVAVS